MSRATSHARKKLGRAKRLEVYIHVKHVVHGKCQGIFPVFTVPVRQMELPSPGQGQVENAGLNAGVNMTEEHMTCTVYVGATCGACGVTWVGALMTYGMMSRMALDERIVWKSGGVLARAGSRQYCCKLLINGFVIKVLDFHSIQTNT